MNFEELFKQVTPKGLCDNFNVLTLAGKDFMLLLAEKKNNYNSMIGSGGGFGFGFRFKKTYHLVYY